MASTLSPEVLALVEMGPIEDLLLALLSEPLVGVNVQSLIEDDQTFPLLIVRRSGDWGDWAGDARMLDAGQISTHAYCAGINSDADAALLSEAVRVVIRDSVNKVVPGKGHVTMQKMTQAPRRVADWASATGPVQYADLPAGVQRYETVYTIEIRKPRNKPFPLTP